ncbi:MAG: sigma-54 dependent transcriptional regulator [Pseudomonadota bacterium]|nr:sigma-54 dependent transcriptional regulator [Pseudomonadota bacterium]
MKKIIIVDSHEEQRLALAEFLRGEGYQTDEAATEVEAMRLIDANFYDLAVIDLCEPDCLCTGMLHWIKTHYPGLEVVVATSFGAIDCVVKTIRLGARNYVMKPVANKEFLDVVQDAMQQRQQGLRSLRRVNEPYCYRVGKVVGVSRSMENIVQTALKVTDFDTGIMIRGESGTGKELIARIIHDHSRTRKDKEFVAINCAAIPNDILESELFGYARGAFTGALQRRRGLIEAADGGTLFMDEIGDTTPQFQTKILRAIQEKQIRRVGENTNRSVDVRIVAATNKDLARLVREGAFREDLFYRLSVIDIFIPPLRERPEDIPTLVDYFLGEINERLKKNVLGVAEEAMKMLQAYNWPGNVRELRNTLERAAVLSGHQLLQAEDFPLAYEHYRRLTAAHPDDEIVTLQEMERRHLLKAMKRYNYNQKLVARKLGIGYTTLWRKLKLLEKDLGATP